MVPGPWTPTQKAQSPSTSLSFLVTMCPSSLWHTHPPSCTQSRLSMLASTWTRCYSVIFLKAKPHLQDNPQGYIPLFSSTRCQETCTWNACCYNCAKNKQASEGLADSLHAGFPGSITPAAGKGWDYWEISLRDMRVRRPGYWPGSHLSYLSSDVLPYPAGCIWS